MTAELARGVFTLSLDFELIWGTLDLFGPDAFRGACERERALLPRLLDVLARHGLGATWCVVGHLFLDHCRGGHPEIVRPQHAWHPGDWFRHDTGGSEQTQPIFFARSLLERIRACPVPQEIGSHSFSHVILGDPGCSRATAESELALCQRVAAEQGLPLRSFAFPRNRVGHLDVLREHGIAVYRGPGPSWYERDDAPGPLGRVAHLLDVMLARRPPVVLPTRHAAGLLNVPGSMIYFPMHGVRRLIPVSRRVRRAVKGLEAAARERKVFHLWFHPTNLADQTEDMLRGLDAILAHAAKLRAQGRLEFRTMGGLADAYQAAA